LLVTYSYKLKYLIVFPFLVLILCVGVAFAENRSSSK